MTTDEYMVYTLRDGITPELVIFSACALAAYGLVQFIFDEYKKWKNKQ